MFLVLTFHTFAVPSLDAVSTSLLLGEKAVAYTAPSLRAGSILTKTLSYIVKRFFQLCVFGLADIHIRGITVVARIRICLGSSKLGVTFPIAVRKRDIHLAPIVQPWWTYKRWHANPWP